MMLVCPQSAFTTLTAEEAERLHVSAASYENRTAASQ